MGLLLVFYSIQTYSWQKIWTGDKFFERHFADPSNRSTLSLWKQALEENPQHYIAMVSIGDILNYMNNLDEASVYFDKAEAAIDKINRSHPNKKQIFYPELFLDKGFNRYLHAGSIMKQILSSTKGEKRDSAQKDLVLAKEYLEEAERLITLGAKNIAFNQERSKSYHLLGNIAGSRLWFFFREGRIDQAVAKTLIQKGAALFEKSLKLNPGEPVIYEDYGKLWFDLGMEYQNLNMFDVTGRWGMILGDVDGVTYLFRQPGFDADNLTCGTCPEPSIAARVALGLAGFAAGRRYRIVETQADEFLPYSE